MGFLNFKLCCTLLMLIALCKAQNNGVQHVCGAALRETLELLCDGGFHVMLKKSMHHGLADLDNGLTDYGNYNDIDVERLPYKFAPSSLFLPKMFGDSSSLMAKTRRARTSLGIYDECCTKGCTIHEIMAYCRK